MRVEDSVTQVAPLSSWQLTQYERPRIELERDTKVGQEAQPEQAIGRDLWRQIVDRREDPIYDRRSDLNPCQPHNWHQVALPHADQALPAQGIVQVYSEPLRDSR